MSLGLKKIITQKVSPQPKSIFKRTLGSIFKKKLKADENEKLTKLRNISIMGFGRSDKEEVYNSNNVSVSFAVLKTDNGYFNSSTKRYAVLLAKDKKNIWTIPVFTMSREKFNSLEDMISAIYDKTERLARFLYDIDKFYTDDIYYIKIDDKQYVFVCVPEAWSGKTYKIRSPLNSKYVSLNWFDQREYGENPDYWKDEYFGNKTADILRHINTFFDDRLELSAGVGLGY